MVVHSSFTFDAFQNTPFARAALTLNRANHPPARSPRPSLGGLRAPDQPYPSDGPRKHMTSQTVGHVLIAVFVILGNIGVFLTMLAKRRKGAGA